MVKQQTNPHSQEEILGNWLMLSKKEENDAIQSSLCIISHMRY